MSPVAILRAVKKCDMLISGGGSLLQDVTSSKSLHYYLSIIRCAEFFHKKVFIYSQGAFEKPYFTTVGMTDESCATVYGYAEGEISKDAQEDTEEIEVVLADREEVKRILREENVAIMCAYQLMHFLQDEEPFAFLKEEL